MVKCLSDREFDKLINNLQKNFYSKDLVSSLEVSFETIMSDLAKTSIYPSGLFTIIIILLFYALFYYLLIGSLLKSNSAYRYFKEHPEKLTKIPMTLHSKCPHCGTSNSEQLENCSYCGRLLKISEDGANYK